MSMFQTAEAAKVWRETAARREQTLGPATDRMIAQARIAPGMRVVDLGCGVGDMSRNIAERFDCDVTGADFSPDMIGAARAAPRVKYVVMDTMALTFPDGAFDAAVARNSIMFLPDLGAALRGVRRVLRRGGRFAAAYWAPFDANPFQGSLTAVARELGVLPADAEIVAAFSLPAQNVEAALTQAGFGEVSSELVAGESRYASVAEAVQALRGNPLQAALFAPLDEAAREKAWAEIAQRFAAYQTVNGAVIPTKLVVTAGTA